MTVMLPEPPTAETEAEVGFRVTEPGEPAWVMVKVWPPMFRVAVRGVAPGLAAATQTWGLAETSTVSQAG